MERSRHERVIPSYGVGQDRLVAQFFVASLAIHLFVIVGMEFFELAPSFPDFTEEWAIDAEILTDIDLGAIPETSLPNAKPAEEAKVPENILPQLPKKFTPKETAPEESVPVPAEVVKDTPKVVPEDKPKEVAKKEPEKVQSDPEEANKLDLKEIRKRKMLEMLRKDEKFAKTTEAPTNDQLAKLAQELEDAKVASATYGSASAKLAAQKYRAVLQVAVRRNYALPEAYNFKDANLQVVIAIIVNARGELLRLDIEQSSADRVFDDMAMKAVQRSAPLPPPPTELAGTKMLLQFTPKSF